MARIQYKQIERIAASCDVGIRRDHFFTGEVESPAIALTGFLSDIEDALRQIRKIAGDSPYWEYPNTGTGVYLVR